MNRETSSAGYIQLYEYARIAEQIDHDLLDQAGRLANRLAWFEARCTESGLRVATDDLGGALRTHAANALPIDQRVRKVGEAFQMADAVWRPGLPATAGRAIDWRRLAVIGLFPGSLLLPLLPGVGGWLTGSASNLWSGMETTWDGAQLIATGAVHVRAVSKGNVGVSAPRWARFVLGMKGKYLKPTSLPSGVREAAYRSLKIKPSKIPGRVSVSGPKSAKDVLGLKGTNYSKATLDSLKPRGTSGLGATILIGAGVKSAEQWWYDYKTFHGDPAAQWSAAVFDGALILTATAGVAVASSLAVGAVLAGAPVIATGLAVVGLSLALGWAVDRFVLDPYLKGDAHKKHVNILADNVREFQRDPAAFGKVFGGEIVDRLGTNAAEFKRDPAAFGEVLLTEYARVSGDALNPIGSAAKTYFKDKAGELVDFIMHDAEPPPASVAL